MAIKFKIKQMYSKGTLPFQLCLQSAKKDSFTITVLQEDDVNLLPADVETIIKNDSTFVIHPSGLFIIDLFQCRGTSQIKYSSEIAKLNET